MGILDKIKDIKKGYDTLNDALGGKAPPPPPPKQEPKKEPKKAEINNPYDSANYWDKLA